MGWTILALPTLVIPFVHFGCDYSPAGVLVGAANDARSGSWDNERVMLYILAAGLCYGALAFVWRLTARWGARHEAARALGISVGAAGVVATVVMLAVFLYEIVRDGAKVGEWLTLGGCVAALLGAAWLLRVIRRRRRHNEFVLGSLLTPFIAVGAFCLIAFFSDAKIGWYLTLFSVPVSAIELVMMAYARDPQPTAKETAGPIRPAVVVSSSSS
jgi:hypothetical protein